jgi:hypothetical protein
MMQMLTMKEDFIYKQIIDRIVRPSYIVTSLLNRRNKYKRKAIMIEVNRSGSGTNRGGSGSSSSSSSSSSNTYKRQLKEEDMRIVSRNYHHLLTNSSMNLCKYPKLMSYNEDNQTDRINVDDEMIYNTIIQSNGDDSIDINNNNNFQDGNNANSYHQHHSYSRSSSSDKTKNPTKSSFSSGRGSNNRSNNKIVGDTLNPSIIFATIANTYDNMSCMHINSSITQMVTGHKDSAVRVWRMNPKDKGFFGRSLRMR